MAHVYGFLRDDKATYGEKTVLKLLKENLPKEFSVYVECPLPGKRVHRYPDFIVVTNYGVIILEVKDWIQVVRADRYQAEIRTRQNKNRREKNPVNQARDIAILLAQELRSVNNKFRRKNQQEIPWGYGVILPNLPTSVITQLRGAWGEEFVFNCDDLDPALILSRLKVTLPKNKVRDLRKHELDFIRATINPTVLIEPDHKPAVILDEEQEQIVSEPVKIETRQEKPAGPTVEQKSLFGKQESAATECEGEDIRDYEAAISRNASIRLVRGIAGSGKSLVLTQRARYLAAKYPEWKIAVLTFNDQLCQYLTATLKGLSNLKPVTFHSLCSGLLREKMPWKKPTDSYGWLENHKNNYPIIRKYGPAFVEDEIKWIKEIGIPDRTSYLQVARKGRGQDGRLHQQAREQIYSVLQDYQAYLDREGIPDWADIPYMVLDGLDSGKITPPNFNAILIDEAQDFAPIWIKVVNRLLDPEQGMLFLADDPAQSIYRFYSWKEKGVHVVGRTRWLKVPYRNTYEIYQAAYQLISTYPALQKSLESEGLLVVPELSDASMRHGIKPLVQRFNHFDEEIINTRERIARLLRKGIDSRQIAVLHRRKNGLKHLRSGLRGFNVHINTFHATKGLEFEVVFLSQLQETLVQDDNEEGNSQERRLVYMAMTRARQQLYMSYEGKLPKQYDAMRAYVDFVE
jgi:hypothetical protein